MKKLKCEEHVFCQHFEKNCFNIKSNTYSTLHVEYKIKHFPHNILKN